MTDDELDFEVILIECWLALISSVLVRRVESGIGVSDKLEFAWVVSVGWVATIIAYKGFREGF